MHDDLGFDLPEESSEKDGGGGGIRTDGLGFRV